MNGHTQLQDEDGAIEDHEEILIWIYEIIMEILMKIVSKGKLHLWNTKWLEPPPAEQRPLQKQVMTDCAEQMEVMDMFWIGQDRLRGAKMDETRLYSDAMLCKNTWSALLVPTGRGLLRNIYFAIQK